MKELIELRDELRDFAKKVRNEEIVHTHSPNVFLSGYVSGIAKKLTALIESGGEESEFEKLIGTSLTLLKRAERGNVHTNAWENDVQEFREDCSIWLLHKNEKKPTDEEIEREAKCHSCGKPLSDFCPDCQRLWES
jgi:hypothetical protein